MEGCERYIRSRLQQAEYDGRPDEATLPERNRKESTGESSTLMIAGSVVVSELSNVCVKSRTFASAASLMIV